MKTKILLFLLFVITGMILMNGKSYAQIENVPLNNPVYDYLKEMNVKRIISGYHDDDPNLSRFQVADFLNTIQMKGNELSNAEKDLLKKYMIEFIPEEINKKTTASMFHSNMNVSNGFKFIFSQKQKYLFSYEKNKNNVFIEPLGDLYYINSFSPDTKENAQIFDGGLRFRGTLFEHLGYNFSFLKGGTAGDSILVESAFPEIKSTFKYQENIENIVNYDFANGYLKYYFEPSDGMGLAFQIGREQLKYGVGYSDRLALSGKAPNLDFLKFQFQYGIINFSSIFGSTVGEYNDERDLRYTKYFTANRLKFAIENLFDVGIGETVISSRGIELGYLNPLIFYKFVEQSLQDRDNGTIFTDIQTHFLKDLEFQGTFFLDENIISNLSNLEKASNKTAYQLGLYYYEPVGIKNLSFIFEYTKIRPYVYSHYDQENTYTAFGANLGHPIGPNADQLFFKLKYNVNEKLSMNLEYQKVRKGQNYYDSAGALVRNVGGNVYNAYRDGVDNSEAYFMDGVRVNNYLLGINIRYEPLKNYVFNFNYTADLEKNLTNGTEDNSGFGYVKFSFGY